MANPDAAAVAFLGLATLGVYSFFTDTEATNSVAAKHALTPEQTAAFKACHSHMLHKSLESRGSTGTIKYGNDPDEICVC